MNDQWYVMDVDSNTGGVQVFDTEEQADTVSEIMAMEGKDSIVFTEDMFILNVGEYENYKKESRNESS